VTAADCIGPCNSRYRRVIADYRDALSEWHEHAAARLPGDSEPAKPEEPDLRPWPGAPVWCGRCQALIRRQLAELDDLGSIVIAFNDGHRTATDHDSRVSGSKTAPSPSATGDDIDDLVDCLLGWESVHRGEDPKARRGDLATVLTTVTSWIVAHFDPMITNPDYAADLGSEIRTWHFRLSARGKAGTGRTPRHLPCPRCQHRSLVQEQGDGYIECTNPGCGRLLSMDDYDAELDERRRRHATLKEMTAA
jgi:hypothetical protein